MTDYEQRLKAENKLLRRIFQIHQEMSRPAFALQPMPDGSLTIEVVGRPLLGELDDLLAELHDLVYGDPDGQDEQ